MRLPDYTDYTAMPHSNAPEHLLYQDGRAQMVGCVFVDGLYEQRGLTVDSHTTASSSKPVSKSAKKNAKRKEKKADEIPGFVPFPPPPAPTPPETNPHNAPAGTRVAVCQKLILKTQKKLKQCDALVKRMEAGDVLTKEEQEKLGKMVAWYVVGLGMYVLGVVRQRMAWHTHTHRRQDEVAQLELDLRQFQLEEEVQ